MRFLRYPEPKKLNKRAKGEVYASLGPSARKTLVRKRIFDYAAGAFCFILFVGIIAPVSWGTVALKQSGINEGLIILYNVFAWIAGAVLAVVLTMLFGAACLKLSHKLFGSVGDDFAAAVAEREGKILKEFYRLDGEYIVTKCFYCSHGEFSGRDVSLFYGEGKLRVVLRGACGGAYAFAEDVGCMEWDLDGCEWCKAFGSYAERYGNNATLVREGEEAAVFGKRALPFIGEQLYKHSEPYQNFEEWLARAQKDWRGKNMTVEKQYRSPHAVQLHAGLSSPCALGKVSYYESNGYHWVDFEGLSADGGTFYRTNIPFSGGESLKEPAAAFERFMAGGEKNTERERAEEEKERSEKDGE